jgi:hypothetical protein
MIGKYPEALIQQRDAEIARLKVRVRAMADVQFEQMLSTRPLPVRFDPLSPDGEPEPCLRDMVFDYYCRKYPNNVERAQAATKSYTDGLHAKFVKSVSSELRKAD